MFHQWWTYCEGRKRLQIRGGGGEEVHGKYSNIKPDTILKQVIHDPKDIIIPEPLTNLITKK